MTTENHRHIPAMLMALMSDDAPAVLTHLRAGMESIGLVALVAELGSLTNNLGLALHGQNWPNVVATAEFELAHDLAAVEARAFEPMEGEGGSES